MFVELFIAVLVLLYLWMFLRRSKVQKLYCKFPGPKPYPLIGNMLEFDHKREEVTITLKKLSYKYGRVFHLTLGGEHIICLRDPSLIKALFSNSNALLDKPPMYDVVKPILEDGLFSCGAEKWKKQRRLLNPAFHMQILDSYIPIFERQSRIFTEKLSKYMEKDFDVSKHASLWAGDILWEAVMGVNMNNQLGQQGSTSHHDLVHELSDIIAHRNFSIIQKSFLFHFLPTGRRHDSIIRCINDMIDKKIKEIKMEYVANKNKTDEGGSEPDNELGIKKKKTFIDLLLEYNMAGAGISDDQLRAEVKSFVIGGNDTTSSAAAFALYCLSQNAHVQERAYKEVEDVLGTSGREANIQDLQNMKYLDQVLKESQRIYPTAQFIARRNNEDLVLENGYIIPKNSTVIVLNEAMGHDPKIFPEPFKFDPDRFEGGNVHPFSQVPLGIGPRNCIGQKFGLLALKSLVSNVLRHFQLLPSDIPLDLRFYTVLNSATGINVRVKPRSSHN